MVSCNQEKEIIEEKAPIITNLAANDHILVEDGFIKVLSDYQQLKIYALSGSLLDSVTLINKNYGYGKAALLRPGYLVQIERQFDFDWEDDQKIFLHYYSTEPNNIKIMASNTITNASPIDQARPDHILVADHYTSTSKVSTLVNFSNLGVGTPNVHFHEGQSITDVRFKSNYTKDDVLINTMHVQNRLLAFGNAYILWGNFDYAGEPYTKDFYLINSDGTYNKILEKKSIQQKASFFTNGKSLFCQLKDNSTSQVYRAAKDNLSVWESISNVEVFTFLGSFDNKLIGKKNEVLGYYNDDLELFSQIKTINYEGEMNQVFQIESNKVLIRDQNSLLEVDIITD